MSKNLAKDIDVLIENGIIDKQTAEKIQSFYKERTKDESNIRFLIFGVLGALLVGLGLILIVAHNWDDLPKAVKIIFAILPVLIAQGAAAYYKFRKKDSHAGLESSSAFLVLSIGACLALISQIFHIAADIDAFLWAWLILIIPAVYILPSNITSLMSWIGITWYGLSIFMDNAQIMPYWYWIFAVLLIPFYLDILKNDKTNYLLAGHNWVIAGSIAFLFASFFIKHSWWLVPGYLSFFTCYYFIGERLEFNFKNKVYLNSYKFIGAVGTIIALMTLSFRFIWKEFPMDEMLSTASIFSLPVLIIICLSILNIFLYINNIDNAIHKKMILAAPFLVLPLMFVSAQSQLVPVIVINLFILGLGIAYIFEGQRERSFLFSNLGLIVITVLIICRFFDFNISFVFRGILFVLIGLGFFGINYWMLKNNSRLDRNTNELNG